MIKLALPDFLILEAGWLAFEILALISSHLGSTELAAQSVLMTVALLASQVPNPFSIAGATRIANLVGAGYASRANFAARVAICGAVF